MQLAMCHAVESPSRNDGWRAGDYEGYLRVNLGLSRSVRSLDKAIRAFRRDPDTGDLFIPNRYPISSSPRKRLSITLAGNNFEKLEQRLSECLLTRVAIENHETVGILFHAIWRSSSFHMPDHNGKADIIVIYLALSLDAANVNLLMHCDYFLASCASDNFFRKHRRV